MVEPQSSLAPTDTQTHKR